MAKTSMIAREKRRKHYAKFAKPSRDQLKEIINSQTTDYDEKLAAMLKLNGRRRDESPIRQRRRCHFCGRPHGVYRRFALCRICLRYLVMFGNVPGVRKASW